MRRPAFLEMENLPAAIFLLLTDYLNDSSAIALFRISRLFWSFHYSPSGRYRVKGNFPSSPRPSKIPWRKIIKNQQERKCKTINEKKFIGSSEFPTSGNFLIESLALLDQADCEEFSSMADFPPLTIKSLFYGLPAVFSFIPSSLVSLRFSDFYNFPLSDGIFPPGLENLRFGRKFSQKINKGILPHKLKSLGLGSNFQEEIQELPEGLEELEFAPDAIFNLPLPPLPASLRILKLSRKFNQNNLIDALPSGLKHLTLGEKFRQPLIAGNFPPALQELSICGPCEIILKENFFPASLKNLELLFFSGPVPASSLPEGLEILNLGYLFSQQLPKLPQNLRALRIEGQFNRKITAGDLPQTLRLLSLGSPFDQPLLASNFPPIEEFQISGCFDQPLKRGCLPESLRALQLHCPMSKFLTTGVFPEALRILRIIQASFSPYSHSLRPGVFPSGLEVLHLDLAMQESSLVPGLFPSKLQQLSFGSAFNYRVGPGIFSSSLISLSFGYSFNQEILGASLPESLRTLELGIHYCSLFPASALPLQFHESSLFDVEYSSGDRIRLTGKEFPALEDSSPLLKFTRATEFSLRNCRISQPSASDGKFYLADPIPGKNPNQIGTIVVHKKWIEKIE